MRGVPPRRPPGVRIHPEGAVESLPIADLFGRRARPCST